MADIFEEIDEDLKQDRVYQWWKQYNKIIIPVVVGICLITGAFFWWQSYQNKKLSAAGSELRSAVELVEAGKGAEAQAVLEKLNSAGGATGMLAGFELAKLAQSSGDTKTSVEHLEKLAGDKGLDASYRDRAKLISLMQQMGEGDADTLFSEFQALASPGSPYRFTAREMMGIVKAQAGDTEAAREILTGLTEMEGAPATLVRRVDAFLTRLQ